MVKSYEIPRTVVDELVVAEQREVERCGRRYRDGRQGVGVRGRIVILADDGLATGMTMRAAVSALGQQPAAIIVAVPVATPSAYEELRHRVDKLVCVIPPQPFDSVGVWYEDASRTTILDVCDLLTGAAFEQTADAPVVPLYEIGW